MIDWWLLITQLDHDLTKFWIFLRILKTNEEKDDE